MKKFLYLIIALNSFVILKADTYETKKTQSLGELSCTVGTAVLFYSAGCSVSAYFHPNITLGLRYKEAIILGSGPAYSSSLLTVLNIYPFKGTFYVDMEVGRYYEPSFYSYRGGLSKGVYISEVWGNSFGFHFGNRWLIFKNLFMGVNYLGFTSPSDVTLIGFELGYRF